MDGAFAAVRFPNKDGFKEKDPVAGTTNNEDIITLLQDCRLMRRDDLQVRKSDGIFSALNSENTESDVMLKFIQVMKANATSRVPDCFQKLPRRVNIPENGSQILSLAVDGQGMLLETRRSIVAVIVSSTDDVIHWYT